MNPDTTGSGSRARSRRGWLVVSLVVFLVVFLVILGPLGCAESRPPLSGAQQTARAFLEAFATGRHQTAARLASGEVLHGVEVARSERQRQRAQDPTQVALLEKALREHPPAIEAGRVRSVSPDRAEVRAVVETAGPHGPERARYRLELSWIRETWLVTQWTRLEEE